MEYLIGAIVLGMLIWAGFEIVQTIRNWETNPSQTTQKIQAGMIEETYVGQFGADAVEAGSQAVESAGCEAVPSAIGHTLESLSHFVHH